MSKARRNRWIRQRGLELAFSVGAPSRAREFARRLRRNRSRAHDVKPLIPSRLRWLDRQAGS